MMRDDLGAACALVIALAVSLILWAIIAGLVLLFAASAHARPEYRDSATAYCLTGRMADGTFTRPRSAAANHLRLGTRIRLVGRPFFGGMRRFVIRDRIGYGTRLDLWTGSCGAAIQWGRRPVAYRIGWGR